MVEVSIVSHTFVKNYTESIDEIKIYILIYLDNTEIYLGLLHKIPFN